jgi:DNA primase
VNWVDGFDAKGRPNKVLGPTQEGTLIYPNNQGATNWYPPSYSPKTGLFYIRRGRTRLRCIGRIPEILRRLPKGRSLPEFFDRDVWADSVPALAAAQTNNRFSTGSAERCRHLIRRPESASGLSR